ncbi:MAG: hypothetical protein ABSE73_10330 [Planctomycetota bacterium]
MAKAKEHPQLSYDALLIHGVMVAFALGTLTVAGFLDRGGKELVAALDMGLIAALALGVWSLVLALRALRKKEASRWPRVVIGLCTLEVLSCGIAFLVASPYTLYDLAIILGLPVFIPVLLLASLISAPIAWWRTRRAEKKDNAKGGAPWDSSRRWKRRLAWYCPVAACVFVVALPIPLFVFCAKADKPRQDFDGNWHEPQDSWRLWVVHHSPETLGEAAARLLSCSKQQWFVEAYAAVLFTGKVSSERLEAELDLQETGCFSSALQGLRACHKDKLLEVVRMVAQGTKTLNSGLEWFIGENVGDLCDKADIDRCLDPAQHPWPSVAFLEGLRDCTELYIKLNLPAVYVANLRQYCDSNPPDREAALKRLAHFAAWPGIPVAGVEIGPLWAKYLSDKDPVRRKQAIATIAFIPTPDASLSVLAAGLESQDETLRQELARNIQDVLIMGYERAGPEVLRRVVKALLPFLDGQDVNAIQDAAWVITTLIKARELEKRVRRMDDWTAGATRTDNQGPLTPDARKLIEEIRAAARKWLGGQ